MISNIINEYAKQNNIELTTNKDKTHMLCENDWAILMSRYLLQKAKYQQNLFYKATMVFEGKTIHNNKYKFQFGLDETVTSDFIREARAKAESLAFKKNKEGFVKLAKNGFEKAIALYLSNTNRTNWDKEIVQQAKKIAEVQIKTPEQWLVCACFEDYAYAKEVLKTLRQLYERNYIALLENYKVEYQNTKEKMKIVSAELEKTNFYHCMEMALIGFYVRFSLEPNKNFEDAYNFRFYKKQMFDFCPRLENYKWLGGKTETYSQMEKVLENLEYDQKIDISSIPQSATLLQSIIMLKKLVDKFLFDDVGLVKKFAYASNQLLDPGIKKRKLDSCSSILEEVSKQHFTSPELSNQVIEEKDIQQLKMVGLIKEEIDTLTR